jgi:hypothetical protein
MFRVVPEAQWPKDGRWRFEIGPPPDILILWHLRGGDELPSAHCRFLDFRLYCGERSAVIIHALRTCCLLKNLEITLLGLGG